MERKLKIMTAAAPTWLAAPLEAIGGAGLAKVFHIGDGAASTANDVAGEDDQGKNALDSQHEPMDNLAQSQQEGQQEFAIQGLSPNDFNSSMQALLAAKMQPSIIPTFLQELVSVAESSSQNVMGLLPLAVAYVQRNPGNYEYVMQNLQKIGEYEAKMPGLGLFQTALSAAQGKPFMEEFQRQRMAIQFMSDDPDTANMHDGDLQKAIMGTVTPDNALKTQRNPYNIQVQEKLQAKENLAINWMKIKTRFDQGREKYLTDTFKKWNEELPGFANGPMGQMIISTLEEIAVASGEFKAVVGTLGIGKNPGTLGNSLGKKPASSGFMSGKSASALDVDSVAIRLAQALLQNNNYAPSSGAAAGTINTSAPPSAQTAAGISGSQSATQLLNSGQAAPNLANTQQVAGQVSNFYKQYNDKKMAAVESQKVLKLQYDQLLSQLSVGDDQAPYLTPQEARSFSTTISQLATNTSTLLVDAIKLYAQVPAGEIAKNDTQAAALGVEGMKVKLESEISQAQNKRLEAISLVECADIDQILAMQKQYIDYYENLIQSSDANMNGTGKYQFVKPYTQVCNASAAEHMVSAQRFLAIARSTQEPSMKQFCLFHARARQMKAQILKTNALREISKMSGLSGGGDAQGMTLSKNIFKFVRTADAELEDYYNDLYKDSPGEPEYGTALEHPVENEGVPTCKIRIKRHKKFEHISIS